MALLEGSVGSDASIGSPLLNPLRLSGSAGSRAGIGAVTITHTGVTDNRVGGRNRKGDGVLTWTPDVTPAPAGLAGGGAYDVAQAFSVPTFDNPTQPAYTVDQVKKKRPRDRIIIGGVDVTYFRGAATPFPGISLIEPLMYNAISITFPQIAACFEQAGVGSLSWLKPGATVIIQRVDPDTSTIVATDYRGIVLDFEAKGAALNVTIGGEAAGRAALVNRQPPIFPTIGDVGYVAYNAITTLRLPFTPFLGPTTGILVKSFGGMSHLDYIHQAVSMAQDTAGPPWTIMPNAAGVYQMVRKDVTTIHGTVYADDARTVADLHRAPSEEPNRIFITGITPEGQRIRFGTYPGLLQSPVAPYPFTDHRNFGEGTTNADTDTGDGITVMIARMQVVNLINGVDVPGGYDGDVTDGLQVLQRRAGLTVTTHMNVATWNALYDLSATGFSLLWSSIQPAAQATQVREWNTSGSGAIMSRNPAFNPSALPVDRNVDVGTGFTKQQMRRWALAELDEADTENWTGSITFNTGGLIKGNHTPGTAISDADFMAARDIRPGMNLKLPLFGGGIIVHVAAATTDAAGLTTVDVDTRARDAMKVWEIIARNRDTRANMARAWIKNHRASTTVKDAIGIWDEVGGILGDKVTIPASTWVTFPVIAGQEGQVRSLRINTNPDAEFVLVITGRKINPNHLRNVIGNPLTSTGASRWKDANVRADLDENYILLYVAGDDQQPLGYFPKVKTDAGATLTGNWQDDAGFPYHTFRSDGLTNPGVLYVSIFADRATHIPPGRIMWDQLGSGA